MKQRNIWVKITLIIILSATIFFHLLIILGFIPFENVWGGRLKSKEEMLKFETLSIFINLVFIFVVFMKMRVLKLKVSPKVITGFLWTMAALFVLNTVGNLFAINHLEKYIATPITLILSILCIILAREKP